MTAEPGGPTSATGTGTVTPQRFAKVRAIFEAALEQPARDRPGFVKGACVGDAALLREVEAMLAADATADPLLDRPASTPSSSAPEEGRFPAGTVLAGRYRILGRLGQGGMGEVYRAHDLILNQSVALKFLAPAHISEAALVRFRNEVRIARQVSHPNVCRVYDLGMVEGLHFLSMEYIDGEDLASLLRRIGRLPQDKAIEFTRKICAGLGAAHERGVLHRDLKPANIMIDGRGQPRITDFGLAGLAAEIPLSDLQSGTPAYMSPEQKAGKEVTTRSDLYSLGLVLHEMFTGKARRETQSSPSELVKDLDPAIERLILRCLEEEPKRRPSSAFNVAMALPGADPIAAALAAGETPSPEMVAASHEKEGFSARVAWLCFATVAILTAALPVVKGPLELTSRIPMDLTPDALQDRARRTLEQLGYPEKPVDSARGFLPLATPNSTTDLPPEQRDAIVASNRPAIMGFWYRQAQAPLSARMVDVRSDTPSNDRPGMMLLLSDTEGRLLSLEIRPPGQQETTHPPIAPDWNVLIHLAGLDPGRFHPVEPKLTPPMAIDNQMAWEGTFSEERHEKVTLEAASWRGRVVFFRGPNDWRDPLTPSRIGDRISRLETLVGFLFLAPFIATLAGGSFVAWRNLRSGRGDQTGALRLAVWMTAAGLLTLPARHHTTSVSEINQILDTLSMSVFWGLIAGGLYLAVEPLVRRNWPDALISWNRLQGRRFNDPLVASHILAGLTILAVGLIVQVSNTVVNPATAVSSTAAFELGREMFLFFQIGNAIALSVQSTFEFLLIVVFLRLVLLPIARGRLWVADLLATIPFAAPVLVFSALDKVDLPPAIFEAVLVAATFSLVLFAVRRFGLLTAMTMAIFYNTLTSLPLVLPSWWSGNVLLTLAMPVALAAWALWVILSDTRQVSTESVG